MTGGPQGSNSGPLLFQVISDKQMTPQILQNSLISATFVLLKNLFLQSIILLLWHHFTKIGTHCQYNKFFLEEI
jgi:hypothetical protein